ncbi:MAG: hypothetical protein ACLUJR_11155 [Mediterraneibacter gnavus]
MRLWWKDCRWIVIRMKRRHTFITKPKRVRMEEYILKRIVGHAINDNTEKTYTHREIEELKAEMRKIED